MTALRGGAMRSLEGAQRGRRSSHAGGSLAALVFAAVWFAFPATARELWSHGTSSLDISGSLREIAIVTEQTDRDEFQAGLRSGDPNCVGLGDPSDCVAFEALRDETVFQSTTRLRLRFDLQVVEGLSAVVAWDNQLRAGDLDTLEADLGDGLVSDSFLGAEDRYLDRDHVSLDTILYRGYLDGERGPFEARVGRQRVAWGVGRLWNPIDRFNPIPPLAIEGDQSPGIDAVLARWNWSGFSFLEAVYAPGANQQEALTGMRLHGVAWDTDWSVVAGLFEKARSVGFDLARNVGDTALRFEVIYTDPERDIFPVGATEPREPGDYWQVLGSIDWTFDWGTGLYVLLEHLYNGNAFGFGEGEAGGFIDFFQADGQPANSAIFAGSRVVTQARHQSGLQLGYDLLTELRGELVTLVDWNGESAVFFPSLRYSPTDYLELTVGAQVGVGDRLSQYGDTGELGFLIAEFFF